MSIYSTQLCKGTQAVSTTATLYTAAAGNTVVIRQITLQINDANGGGCILEEGGVGIATLPNGIAQNVATSFTGRWVMNPGETIQLITGLSATKFHISGYVLT